MAIKYNSNKKTTFNNYIDTAVSNLKKAETETSCILNFTFPSKTIIGRRFNKKSQISTLKGNIASAYTSLSTIKADVQEQVNKYLKVNSMVIANAAILKLNSTLLKATSEFGFVKEGQIKEVKNIFELYGDDEDKLKETLKKYGYEKEDLEAICLYLYEYYKEYRYKESKPEYQKKAWKYYDLLNEVLMYTTGVLYSDTVKETNPLDENYDERTDKTGDMLIYLCFMENTFTDSSQCQGAAWIGDNKIAICDIDGKLDKGVIRIIEVNPDEPFDIKIIAEIPVDGHSNDIEYLPDEGIILHPNHKTKEIEAIYLNNELQEEKREVIQNVHANAISYDKENEKIILIEDIKGDVYSKDDFLQGKESKKKFVIPDQIKDNNNDIYYNLKGGATAKDGKIYVSYTGYDKDKRQYNGDIPKGTMTAVYDSETGECLGRYITDCNGEVESVTLDDDGNLVWIENCENNTYVLKSDNNRNEE